MLCNSHIKESYTETKQDNDHTIVPREKHEDCAPLQMKKTARDLAVKQEGKALYGKSQRHKNM